MKHRNMRLPAALLTVSLLLGLLPSAAVAEALDSTASIQNANILAEVSKRTGGFSIRTLEGDAIQKDDDNKNLLFPLGDDDTSFASLRVTRGNVTKDYVFGGKYDGSSDVAVAATDTEITATWSVDGITVTQTLRLAGGNEHGMAYLSYSAKNTGAPANVQLRLVMDTALGTQDFGHYQVSRTTGEGGGYLTVENEKTVTSYGNAFMTYDDLRNPSVIAYFLNGAVGDAVSVPKQVTFAHWVHLASTVFDYEPDPDFSFVTPYNAETLTADSAFALYYDLGEVATNGTGAMAAYYGVFSNQGVAQNDRVTMNFTALPEALELTPDKKGYTDGGDFTVTMQLQNITAETLSNIRVAVYPGTGITPYDATGTALKEEATYLDPHYLEVVDLAPEGSRSLTFRFHATPERAAAYRKLTFRACLMDGTGDTFKQNNLLCEKTAWIVCPGTESALPEVTFTGSSPDLLYVEGTRSLFLTGTNFSILDRQRGSYILTLKRTDGSKIDGKDQLTVFNNSEEALKNRFPIDVDANTAQVVLTEDLLPGEYQLTVDYQDTQTADLTAPALRFAVTDDPAYRSDGYGVVTVENDGSNRYSIHAYRSEEVYESSGKELDNETVLLEFRGLFTEEDGGYTAVSLNKNDNPVSLNGCLDIRDGRVTITDQGGVINVDFDASLTLPGVGTSVWKGPCCLTSIEDGEEAALTAYDEKGESKGGTITLLWPSVGQAAQELLGLLFEFKYGELGILDDGTGVIGFGGALDLSFLVPASLQSEDDPNALDQARQEMLESGGGSPQDLRELEEQIPHDAYTSQPFETATDTGDGADAGDGDSRSASVEVDDILFGDGRFIGVNFAVAIGLPSYIEGMPGIEGVLRINTIDNWSVGVSGAASFATFNLSAEISVISRNNIPVPDTLSFFVGGFVPGVNVDGFGVLWLQGAGGGIENLYDTIFLTEAVPPLQLILQAQFSILQVISAKATLELSLRGIGAELSNGTVANALVVMDSARVELDWYPEFFFLSSVNMNIADVITGGGYIVVEGSGFFEFFIKAALQLPGSLPLIGGLTLADVGLGANADKIWGAANALGVDVGVTYFWGGDLEWNGSSAAPSYPDLLSVQAVYTSPDTGRTLYAGVGSNLTVTARSDNQGIMLLADDGDTLTSADLKTTHTLTLQESDQAAALSITWDSASLADAQKEMALVTVSGGSFTLKPVRLNADGTVDTRAEANTSASYDEANKKAIMTVTFQPDEAGPYAITTPKAADLTLYRVGALPKLTDVTVAGDNSKVTVSGTGLDQYSTIYVTAVDAANPDNTRLLNRVEGTFVGSSVDVLLNIPADLPSGSYTIRAAAYDADRTVTGLAETETPWTYANPNQPNAPTVTGTKPAGDCKVSFTTTGDASIAGYRVNFYDADGSIVPGVSGVELARSDNDAYTAGGRYTNYFEKFQAENPAADGSVSETMGLQPNMTYTMGVSAYTETADGVRIYSEEAKTQVTVPEPTPPKITWSATEKAVTVTQTRGDETFPTDAYTINAFTATLTADQAVTGAWTLDGGAETTVSSSKNVDIPLQNLSEGSHTLQFWGTNAGGDAFRFTKTFLVDTVPPLLQLSGPVDGSFFGSTAVTLSGMAEGTTLTLAVDDGATQEIDVVGGIFSVPLTLDADSARHVLTLTATDEAGNQTVRTRTLVNDRLGQMTGLALYRDGVDITGKTVAHGGTTLELRAVLEDGSTLVLNDPAMVEWSLQTVAGSPTLEDGVLTFQKGDIAMIQASFQVLDAEVRTAYAVLDSTKEETDPAGPGSDSPGTSVVPSSGSGYYAVISPQVSHGTVTASPTRARSGQTVQLTVTPEQGYVLAALTVEDSRGRQLTLTDLGGGKFSFQMPARAVTLKAVFQRGSPASSCDRGPACPAAVFDDVVLTAWYHDGIHYCVEEGLMIGTSATAFEPNAPTSRAMIATILWRLRGSPTVREPLRFADVAEGQWYSEAVRWADSQGIVEGYDAETFGPHDNITREQLAALLWRCAGSPESSGSLEQFTDGETAGSWAAAALAWAVEQGIVTGKGNGILDPRGSATRAEAAAMLMRYCESPSTQ